jgi:AraC family transcriptional regulator
MNSKQKYLREEYTARVNRVIDHIEANIDQELSLAELAGVAGFSAFHFHRIFSALVGEPLNSFIQRIRIEKAASMLKQNPKKAITSVALDCGFSSASTFAREFREAFGVSASEWRAGVYSKESKYRQMDSKERQTDGNIRKEFVLHSDYSISMNKQEWRVEMKPDKSLIASIEVKDTPEFTWHISAISARMPGTSSFSDSCLASFAPGRVPRAAAVT